MFAAQVEDRVSVREQALAKLFLEQEWQLREEDRAKQRELFQQLLTIMTARTPAPAASPTPWRDHPATYQHQLGYHHVGAACAFRSHEVRGRSTTHHAAFLLQPLSSGNLHPSPCCQVRGKYVQKGNENVGHGDMQKQIVLGPFLCVLFYNGSWSAQD